MNMVEATDSESDAKCTPRAAMTPLWSAVTYPGTIGKSMRAMMTSSRLRTRTPQAADSPDTELFADAVARKDKEKMLDALAKDIGVLQRSDKDDRLPLHHVCALRPNYRYVDMMMMMMINTYPDAAYRVDKTGQTPLHVLCTNPSVTVQALGTFDASIAELTQVPDQTGNLPLHCLCRNSSCDVGKIKKLNSDLSACMTINNDGQTPFHCLVTTDTPLNKAVLYYMIEAFPDVAIMRDMMGRTILHWVCESQELDITILNSLFATLTDAASLSDSNGDLPLHILCQNEAITRDLLRLALQVHPMAVSTRAKALSPLHFLCSNESCNVELLSEYLSFDIDTSSIAQSDMFGATALHLLCMNEAISTPLLRTMLLVCSDNSLDQDVHGRSPLHYLCMNRAISPELLWLVFDRKHDLVRQVDKDDRTPLHYLCGNSKVTPRVLEILFDSYPGAALLVDRDFKLPVQYLVDNSSISSEVPALLICGPASYRHRYEFLSANGQCACFTQDSEVLYVQTNMAMDSNTAAKVLVNFYSSQAFVEHEQKLLLHLKTAAELQDTDVNYSLITHETFDNAKRRLSLRTIDVAPEDHNCDASVTLDFALVMEAPLYTLGDLRAEELCDTDVVGTIIKEIANVLIFWHRDARMVHGNIVFQNVGQFESSGLCLYNLSTSRELKERRTIGSHAVTLSSCAPEAAKAFIAKEEFLPTQASDMWQFGCLVYQLITGNTLLQRLAPWSESIGHEQGLHLLCSITDAVLATIIAEISPELQPLLQRTLILNPSCRCDVGQLLHIEDGSLLPSLVTSEAPSQDFMDKIRVQKAKDALIDDWEMTRSVQHVQEQLEFMKKEQALVRHTLHSMKSQLREADEACKKLQLENDKLQTEMIREAQQRQEAQLEAQLLARNHQSMTLQLHVTVQMLLHLVPLARKVHGTAADDFLSRSLAQATQGSPSPYLPSNTSSLQRPVQFLKKQLQHNVLAQGCVQKWANSTLTSALTATESLSLDKRADSSSDDEEEKRYEDQDGSAA